MADIKIDGVEVKLSKEFQVKLRHQEGEKPEDVPKRLLELLRSIEARGRYKFKIIEEGCSWKRRGERYDTLPNTGLLRNQGISLATEKGSDCEGNGKTKLKCKLHNLVPELLYKKPKKSWCWPKNKVPGVDRKFKLEQDVHFNNTKYCATGYMSLPGDHHQFLRVKDFKPYFPRLMGLPKLNKKMPLIKVKDWDEHVHDGMKFEIGGMEVEGALVTRINRRDGSWDETEFSFKLKQGKPAGKKCKKSGKSKKCKKREMRKRLQPGAGWSHRGLKKLALVYQALFDISSVFIQSPSIFYFDDPVSSKGVELD